MNEPERPIEGLLRASAKKRREQAGTPFELHPVTRRLLQDEVRSTFQPRRASDRKLRSSWSWAFGGALALALAVLAWQSFNIGKGPSSRQEQNLTRTTQLAEGPALVPAETMAPAARPGLRSDEAERNELAKSVSAPLYDRATPSTNLSLTVASATPGPPLIGAEVLTNQAFEMSRLGTFAAATNAGTGAMPGALTVNLSRESLVPAQQVQFFSDIAQKDGILADNASAQAVLTSFALQQNGNELSVVDRDGSLYRGYLEPQQATVQRGIAETKAPRAKIALSESRARSAPAAVPAPTAGTATQYYYFRVVGTNQKLNEKVVFTGTLLTPTNTGTNTIPPNSRIEGRAVIGDREELQINAVPGPR